MSEYDLPDTEKEAENYLGFSPPEQQERFNVFKFFDNVVHTPDTTKLGNLTAEEVGAVRLPIRTLKELSLFCEEIANMKYFSTYFNKESEIQTSTSLSKEALLLRLAVSSRREIADVTKQAKENKGWFKKKKKDEDSSLT